MDIIRLLGLMAQNCASDLHLAAGRPPLMRVDGNIRRMDMDSLPADQLHKMLRGIMTQPQEADYETDMEIDFALSLPDSTRFRVNVFNQLHGPAAVFRLIPARVQTLEDLNAPPVFAELGMRRKGLVLVTGPTGSGKSTTLAAIVNHINENRRAHILTIEDPIEFVHIGKRAVVNQRELGRHTVSFGRALKSALREDPDVILVGEMRDPETIRLALTAAETGHLVLTTLHTVSAAKAMDRIIDVFPNGEKDMVRAMLSESLEAVISQLLLPKTSGGRVAAWEILLGIPAVRNLIRENKIPQIQSVIQTNQAIGMQTMERSVNDLVRKQIISPQTAQEWV